jgi:hypothetical protein
MNKFCGENTGSLLKNSYRAQAKPVLYSRAIAMIKSIQKLLVTIFSALAIILC